MLKFAPVVRHWAQDLQRKEKELKAKEVALTKKEEVIESSDTHCLTLLTEEVKHRLLTAFWKIHRPVLSVRSVIRCVMG